MDTEQAMTIVLKMAKDEWVVGPHNIETTRQAIEEVENYVLRLGVAKKFRDKFWKGGYKAGPTGCDYGIGG